MTLARRLAALTKRYPCRPERAAALDLSALSPEEQVELLELAATLETAPTLPNGRPDLSRLSDAELARLDHLAARTTDQETP